MKILPFLSCIVLFAGIAYSQNSNSCGDLLKIQSSRLPNSKTVLTSAVANAARPVQGNAAALPEHCEVLGRINERTGANGQKYAINFHLRLPAAWNGNFFFEGGGGANWWTDVNRLNNGAADQFVRLFAVPGMIIAPAVPQPISSMHSPHS